MKNSITLKFLIFLTVLMTTFSHLYSADGDSVSKPAAIEAVPISGHTYLRDRHEWFTAGVAIGPMGLNVRLTSPAIRLKNFVWEPLVTEGLIPLYVNWYFLFGGAIYTKPGYIQKISYTSDVRFSLGIGWGGFLGWKGAYATTMVGFAHFYIDPEISFVRHINEKFALQIGISAPIILPYIFPYPVRLFMGFRY